MHVLKADKGGKNWADAHEVYAAPVEMYTASCIARVASPLIRLTDAMSVAASTAASSADPRDLGEDMSNLTPASWQMSAICNKPRDQVVFRGTSLDHNDFFPQSSNVEI